MVPMNNIYFCSSFEKWKLKSSSLQIACNCNPLNNFHIILIYMLFNFIQNYIISYHMHTYFWLKNPCIVVVSRAMVDKNISKKKKNIIWTINLLMITPILFINQKIHENHSLFQILPFLLQVSKIWALFCLVTIFATMPSLNVEFPLSKLPMWLSFII